MRLITKLTGLALAIGLSGAANAGVWGYEGDGAPEKWGELAKENAACSEGKYQTPIDIKEVVQAKLPVLKLNYPAASAAVVNNGHAIQVNMKQQNDFLMLDGVKFTLRQFHFHAPSENHINGKSYPIEGHFVHTDDKGHIAVVGVMFEIGKPNAAIGSILSQVSEKEDNAVDLAAPVNIQAMLPARHSYYRFSGSLTTPPCSEGVAWMVLKTPVTVSSEQEAQMRAAVHQHNNRPLQPLNGRVIVGN